MNKHLFEDRALEKRSAYRYPHDRVVTAQGSDARQGLTTREAQFRLQRSGRNALPSVPPIPAWQRFLAQFWSPLTLLLLVATAISLTVWWIERDSAFPYESLTIFAIVLLNAILGYSQEHRAEQAVAALQAMTAVTTRVLRDGYVQTISTTGVVPGDILVIEEGDSIAADARVLEAIGLRVEEAALTGESTPAAKSSAAIDQEVALADQRNMVFSGTAAAAGRGRAIVTATGVETQIGRIAGSLQHAPEKRTPLQRELDRVGRWLGMVVMVIALVMSATILLVDRVGTLGELVDILLLAVSLAVAAVPEGLTAITTIILSLGMQRMARRNVIVRKLSEVETLGSTTVICTDKTGTLTKNEMTVRAVVTASGRVDFTGVGYDPRGSALHAGQPLADAIMLEEVKTALRAAYLVNNATLLCRDGSWTIQGDPTEGALLVAAHKVGLEEEDLEGRFPRTAEVPFSSERKLMSTAHRDASRDEHMLIFSKGAPDVLLARCAFEQVGPGGQLRLLAQERRAAILAEVAGLASEALRTIGVALRTVPREELDEAGELSERMEQEFVWLGVIAMIDPPRPEAAASVRLAQRAGIRVLMITGDHPITAVAIARELGILDENGHAVTGFELERADDEALRKIVREISVYARVAPEQKLRIVQALQANGEIVAMTGDGVNDAPALKLADIGIAMGLAGTDVAKGAADMILTDDNFASIVAAVEEGRSIFANIQKFLRYLLSSNIGEVLTMFFGVILADAVGLMGEAGTAIVVPLLATQILWINLLTDAGPALGLGVDPRDPRQMHRPPRSQKSRVISNTMWASISIVGVIMAAGTLFVVDWSLPGGLIPGKGTLHYAQTMAFTTLVLAQLCNVFNARSDESSAFRSLLTNKWVWLAILLSLLLQVAVVYLPLLESAFSTVPLGITDWLLCLGVASMVLWGRELTKLAMRRLSRSSRREHAIQHEEPVRANDGVEACATHLFFSGGEGSE
jgi:Ca2+-transporting ATPase